MKDVVAWYLPIFLKIQTTFAMHVKYDYFLFKYVTVMSQMCSTDTVRQQISLLFNVHERCINFNLCNISSLAGHIRILRGSAIHTKYVKTVPH